MNEKKNLPIGIFLACFTIFIWGITFVCTKYLLQTFSSLEILFIRFFLAYICLWILCPKKLKLIRKSDEILFVLAGLCGVTVYQFLENIAINYTTASNVSIIVSICPMFTAIIAQIVLKEKHITLQFIIGFVVAICGIALVSFNGTAVLHLSPKGDILALMAAISWGFYSLFVSILNRRGYGSLASTRHIFFWAIMFMLLLIIFGAVFNGKQTAIHLGKTVNAARFSDWKNYLCLGFLGILASAFAFAAWNKACAVIGTVKATVGIYMIPVVTIIFAFFALGEKLSVMGACGAALTLAGLLISEFQKRSN